MKTIPSVANPSVADPLVAKPLADEGIIRDRTLGDSSSIPDQGGVLPSGVEPSKGAMRTVSPEARYLYVLPNLTYPESRGFFCRESRLATHCGQSLLSVIAIMINDPIATTTGQMNGNSSSTPTTTARTRRDLFICAKRQPATPIGHLRLAPSSSGLIVQRDAIPPL